MNKNISLMTHVVVGYRTIEETVALVQLMSQKNVSCVELQFPFSDPIGDGPTISLANHVALQNGMTTNKAFEYFEKLSVSTNTPLLIMTYANIIYRLGFEAFFQKAQAVGAKGIIVPDFPFDWSDNNQSINTNDSNLIRKEAQGFFEAAEKFSIPLVPVLSPNSSKQRIEKIASQISDLHKNFMVYSTLRVGVTGTHTDTTLTTQQDEYLQNIRSYFSGLLACGFGIDSVDKVLALQGKADLAVIGSHIIKLFSDAPVNSDVGLQKVDDFLTTVNTAIRN